MRRLLWAVGLSGCASVQAPTGGPPDLQPPHLRRIQVRQKGSTLYLTLVWDEYLSLSSTLTPTGVWTNPSFPMTTKLRGKKVLVRLDSLAPGSCVAVWAGQGIKDFTENNPIPPQLVWKSCIDTLDTLEVRLPLAGAAEVKEPIWGEVYTETLSYRFMGWKGALYCRGLPPGTYSGWAWVDIDGSGNWSLHEPVYLPAVPLSWPTSDTLRPWHAYTVDTVPPRPPSLLIIAPESLGLFSFAEPIYFLSPQPSLRALLTEQALLVRLGDSIEVADSAGNRQKFPLHPTPLDTPAANLRLFWPAALNAVTPWLVLRTVDSLPQRDTFWTAQIEGKWYIGYARLEGREICLSPLPVEGEVEFRFWDTVRVRLPARKYPLTLPTDSVGWGWRLYGPTLLGGAPYVDAPFGAVLWLPPGRYPARRLECKPPCSPVGLKNGRPFYQGVGGSRLIQLSVGEDSSKPEGP
ncbi:MAG: hypothetical protein NZ958_00235 [Bacteroidia bacterium]|nr:hypothetical protein [Bacteroidia bacterium]MDW8088182.1 hypothetical protein [Bacteroidia bacterium]